MRVIALSFNRIVVILFDIHGGSLSSQVSFCFVYGFVGDQVLLNTMIRTVSTLMRQWEIMCLLRAKVKILCIKFYIVREISLFIYYALSNLPFGRTCARYTTKYFVGKDKVGKLIKEVLIISSRHLLSMCVKLIFGTRLTHVIFVWLPW